MVKSPEARADRFLAQELCDQAQQAHPLVVGKCGGQRLDSQGKPLAHGPIAGRTHQRRKRGLIASRGASIRANP